MLFCDLVGSTQLMTRIGEPMSDEVRRDLFEALRRPIGPFRGEEVRSQGDGLMVAFRASSWEALSCAAAMQRATARLSVPDVDEPLAIRVGVSGGEVTHEEDDWYGGPVVEAARLCAAALPSQILVANRVVGDRSHSSGLPLRSVGSLALKGLPGRLPTSELDWAAGARIGPKSGLPIPPPLDLAGEPPLVARDTEMAVLVELWKAIQSGASGALLVRGPPRVGRTRLMAEWASHVHDTGGTVLYGSVSRRGGGVQALADALRRYVLWVPRTTAIQLAGVPSVTSIVPSLATRTAAKPPPPSGAAGSNLVADASAEVLTDAAARGPTLLVLDDLNWADPVLLDAVVQLVASSRVSSLVVALTFRTLDGESPSRLGLLVDKLETLPSTCALELAAFSIDEIGEVLTGMGVADTSRTLARKLAARTGGVAGDVVDVARSMVGADVDNAGTLHQSLVRASPFKGLLAYEPEDCDVFFGRDALAAEVANRLARDRFVAVVGPSGCGKSSLVKAGAMPQLTSPACVMSPGVAPVAALEDVLRVADHGATVVIDQLEELFTLCDDDDVRSRFLDRVLRYIDSDDGSIITTIRGDFYGHCALHAGFGARVAASTVLVGPMTEDELRLTIEGPAHVAGLELEVGLVDVVLGELATSPTALPLLSHALLETWRNRRGSRLTMDDYRDTGGVRGAIARSAERVYTTQLDGDEQALARSLLLRLVEPSDVGDDTRRPGSHAELRTALGTRCDRVLDRLVAGRLLTVDHDTVELAHETLVREWPRFREWIDDERDQLRLTGHLGRAANDWTGSGRPDTDLYRGARLDAALDLVVSGVPLTDTEREFLAASSQRSQGERDTFRRTNRRLRRLLVGAIAAVVIALVASATAVMQQRTAENRRRTADEQRRASQVALLSAQARDLVDVELDLASLLAVEAHRRSGDPDAIDALADVLRAQPAIERFTSFDGTALRSVDVGGDGRRGAVLAGDRLVRFELPEMSIAAPVTIPDAERLAVSPDSTRIAITTPAGVTIVDAASGETETAFPAPDTISGRDPVGIAWVGPSTIALRGSARKVSVVDAATGVEVAPTISSGGHGAIAGSSDGRYLAIAPQPAGTAVLANTSTVRILDALTGDVSGLVEVASGRVLHLAFQSGGDLLAIGTEDAGLFVVNTTSGETVFERVTAVGASARFSPDGKALAIRDEAGKLSVVESTTGKLLVGPVTQAGELRDAFFGEGTDVLLVDTVSSVMSVRLDGREPLASAPFGEPGELPGAVRGDGRVVWGLRIPSEAPASSTDFAESVAYDPVDGRVLRTLPNLANFYGPDDDWVYVGSGTGGPDSIVDPTSGALLAVSTASFDRLIMGGVDGSLSIFIWASWDGDILDVRQLPDLSRKETGLRPLRRDVLVFALSSDGSRIAFASAERQSGRATLSVLEVASGDEVIEPVEWPDENALPRSISFSSDDAVLAVGDEAGGIALLDVRSRALAGEQYQGMHGPVIGLDFTDDGRLWAVSHDGFATIFDARSGQPLGPPVPWVTRQDEYSVVGAYMPMADLRYHHLLVTDPQGLRVWNIDPATWPAIACERAGRNLTVDEWARYLPPGEPYRRTCAQFPAG